MDRWIAARRIAVLLSFLVAAVSVSGCGGEKVTGSAESVAILAGAAGGPGYFDGTGALVRFAFPSGAAVVGTSLFVADNVNHVIRKIDTATGNVTTLAGKFGVPGSADNANGSLARFNGPTGIVADGTSLYVCDTGNHTIRKIVSTSGAVTTLAGGAGSPGAADNTDGALARFNKPRGIAIDALTSTLYVADAGNHKIRAVNAFTGATTTYAGTGVAGSADNVRTSATFSSPEGVAFEGASNLLYVADTGNHTIRKIVAAGDVTLFAGSTGNAALSDGTGTAARFSSPSGIAAVGTTLYVADTGNNAIRSVDTGAGVLTPAGSSTGTAGYADGSGTSALFNGPKGIGTNGTYLYVADTRNQAIRRVTVAGAATTVAGNPPQAGSVDATGGAARFRAPAGAAAIGDNVFVADTGNGNIRKIASSGVVTTVPGSIGAFASPVGIAAIGTTLYVIDNVNHTVSGIPAEGGTVTVLAGLPGSPGSADGSGAAARFSAPRGIATDGTNLFVADTGNHTIRQVTTGGTVTTLAGLAGSPGTANGTGGSGGTARFNAPQGIAAVVASLTTTLYVSDSGNHSIRRIAGISAVSPSVTVFAGTAGTAGYANGSGGSALFSSPAGIAASGSTLYLADAGNHAIRRITSSAAVTTFLGDPEAATTRDGPSSQALLNAPAGIAATSRAVHFTDVNENVVRKILY